MFGNIFLNKKGVFDKKVLSYRFIRSEAKVKDGRLILALEQICEMNYQFRMKLFNIYLMKL